MSDSSKQKQQPQARQPDKSPTAPSQFTEHFSLGLLTQSDTATARGINNTPLANGEVWVVDNLEQLSVKVLEPIWALLTGDFVYSSGYRCKALNTLLGSSDTSQHRSGMAVDFQTAKTPIEQAFQKIKSSNIPFDQLIIEGSAIGKPNEVRWIHVSHDPGKAQQRRVCYRIEVVNGKNTYLPV